MLSFKKISGFCLIMLLALLQLILTDCKVYAADDGSVSSLNYIDLNNWSDDYNRNNIDDDNGDWVVVSGGREVTQNINGDVTMFISDEDVINEVIKGTICVDESGGDDDFIGFVLGYQEPHDSIYDFVLFDWKKKDQTYSGSESYDGLTAYAGYTLCRATGYFDDVIYSGGLGSSSKYFWFHQEEEGKFKMLATDYNSGRGWNFNHEYMFEILYTEDRIRINVDGQEVFDVEGTFTPGKIGFYNYSQAEVTYGRVKSAPGTSDSAAPIAQADLYGMVKDTVLDVDKYDGILANDYDPNLDNYTITRVDDVTNGSLNFSQDGSFTYTPDPGYTGPDSFIYYLTDSDGEKSAEVEVNIYVMGEANAAPTDITLTNSIVELTSEDETIVGTLNTTDPNEEDSHDYMLIDNADGMFGIADDKIVVNNSSLLSLGTHDITVRSTDLLGLYVDEVLTITVQDTCKAFTYTAGENGNITGDVNQLVPLGEDGAEVTAVPDLGYHFDSWSDGVLTAARTDTNIGDNLSVTAHFAINTPDADTNAATGINATAATFNGTVNANDVTTTVTFEYGIDTTYGTSVTADQSPVSGSDDTSVSAVVSELTPETTYHYRVKCVGAGGTVYGADNTFTTLQMPATPSASVAVNNGTIKRDAVITLSSEPGATIYYTTALNSSTPDAPSTSVSAYVSEGGSITYPVLTYGDVLKIKAVATVPGKGDSEVMNISYTVQSKSTLTITGSSAASKDYDGTCDAEVTGGTLAGSIVENDDVALVTDNATGQFSDKNTGRDKAVTVMGYTLSGTDADYYSLEQPVLAANIRKRDVTAGVIVINDKIYDGSADADISSITLSWKYTGDDVYVDIPAATAVFSDAGVENNKEVSVTGLELVGSDEENYQLTSTIASASGNIIPNGTVAAPIANPPDDSVFSGVKVTLSTSTDGAIIHYTLDGSEPTSSSSTYTDPIPITGTPGTVVTVKAVAVKTGMIDSGMMTKQYTIAPPGTFSVTAVPDDQTVVMSWDAVSNAAAYDVYNEDNFLGNVTSLSGDIYGYNAVGLTNGTSYDFTVNALDDEQCVISVAQVSAIPLAVPGAPRNVMATAGNTKAEVSFTAPLENGGSEITGYIVTSNPGDISVSSTGSPVTVKGLTNGTFYTFTVRAVNVVGNGPGSEISNTVRPHAPSSGSSYTPVPDTTEQGEDIVEILVNGKIGAAATQEVTKENDKTVTKVTVDHEAMEESLQQEGNNAKVTITITNDADVVVGQINGQTVKNMEKKEAVLEIKTSSVMYKLPAAEINIDNVSEQIGKQVELKDIAVDVRISEPSQETVKIVEDMANKNNYQVVVKPVEFEITCSNGERTVEVSRFNRYIERMVAIPDGIDAGRVTTGIIVNSDGTLSHVPTTIVIVDGKHYARINSLTNSAYSLIWCPKEYKDAENHWAKDAMNDMGSRLVMEGIGDNSFAPERGVGRDEFAEIVVNSLGLLRPGVGIDVFNDVDKNSSYYDAVSIAYDYGIIAGYGNGNYGPVDKITREEAMTIVVRAMEISGLRKGLKEGEAEELLARYTDSPQSSAWAKESIAVCIKAGIVMGRDDETIAPKDEITRAETAVIVRRLLQQSELI